MLMYRLFLVIIICCRVGVCFAALLVQLSESGLVIRLANI